MFHKNFKSRCFFSKSHCMDSQINKIHSPTIFCVVLSDLIGFWDASVSHSDPTCRHIHLILCKFTLHCDPLIRHILFHLLGLIKLLLCREKSNTKPERDFKVARRDKFFRETKVCIIKIPARLIKHFEV